MTRKLVDIAMACVFVALMTTATVEEVEHEWLGIAMFVLFVVHVILNRKWVTHLFTGRYTLFRVLSTLVTFAVLLCMVGQVVSSLILSEHAFGFLPALPGASWARVMHMLCSYWGFVLVFVHAGFHVRSLAARKGKVAWLAWPARVVWLAVAGFGAWSFVQLNIGAYLLLHSQFLFVDPTVPLVYTAAEYAAIGVLIAGVAHYAAKLLKALAKRPEEGGHSKREMTIPRGQERKSYEQ